MNDIYFSYDLDNDMTVLLTDVSREEFALELLNDIWAEAKLPAQDLQAIDRVIQIFAERKDFR